MKHITPYILAALFALLPLTVHATGRSTVELPERVVIADARIQEVTLGTIAKTIAAADPELDRELRNLVITESPESGQRIRLSRNHIIRSIRAARLPIFDIDVNGSNTFDVYGPGQEVTPAQIVDALQRSLLMETGWPEDELVLRINSALNDSLWLPPGDIEVSFDRYNHNRLGSSRVEMGFYINKIETRTLPINVTIERRRTLPVLRESLSRGDVITRNDVVDRVVFVKDQQVDDRIIDDPTEIIGRRVRNTIHSNTPILDTNLETNYVIRRGDRVELVLESNGLLMRTSAKAKDRGAPGDVIPVETAQTGKLVKARIINHEQVVWVQ